MNEPGSPTDPTLEAQPGAVLAAVNASSNLLLLLLGPQGTVLDHTRNIHDLVPDFLLPLPGEPLEPGQILEPREGGELDLAHLEGNPIGIYVTLAGTERSYRCTRLPVEPEQGLHLLVCDAIESQTTDVLETFSQLHQGMANLSRKLKQRNDALSRANERIEQLMRTDPLTGLANRRALTERLEVELSRARRHVLPMALAICDLDKFKSVNDTYGHDAGDRVLVAFAEVFTNTTRAEDLPVRFGGEEFVLLLPDTPQEEARAALERVRQTQAEQQVLPGGRRVTASFGLAMLREDDTLDSLLKRADEALYEAKNGGRNRIVVAP